MGSTRILINSLCKQYSKLNLQNYTCSKNVLKSDCIVQSQPSYAVWRYSHTFLSRLTAEQLWKGVTSVSPAGRRKGRGRNKKMAKDLNRGQVIGFGKINMVWPGLNAPIVQGREVIRQQLLPPDENREKRLIELRNKSGSRRRVIIHPLERGWSGTKLTGRSLGPPDPVGDETFEGFDSRVLQFRPIFLMHGLRGRIRQMNAFVVVGNKNGLAGFALSKSTNGAAAAKAAKNKAATVLRYINRDGTSVIHDFFSQFGAVRVFVEKRPEGHGLVCHRAIKAICEMLGIKDLWAKVEGPTKNTQHMTRAFFIGLHRQKSLEQIANEKGLHVVKLQQSRDFFPEVVASPTKCRTDKEIGPTELLDFKTHLHDGREVEAFKKFVPFYINFPSYIKEMKDREKCRNHKDVRLHLVAKHGELKSWVQLRIEEKAKKELKDTVEQE